MRGRLSLGKKVEELSRCHPGTRVAAYFEDDKFYHERILLWCAGGIRWVILTPDYDVYIEDFSEPLVPYWDPQLRYNKTAYNDLVRRLHGINYFRYTTKPACKVGIFFVWKSNKTRLRLITDARLSNRCFKVAVASLFSFKLSSQRFNLLLIRIRGR